MPSVSMIRGALLAAVLHLSPAFASQVAALAYAQSITLGSVTGTVRDSRGGPIPDAIVTIRDITSGVSRQMAGTQQGGFTFPMLQPSEYEVSVESLGYRPRVVRGIVIFPGREQTISIDLAPAEPPVTVIDTVQAGSTGARGSQAGRGRWYAPFTLRGIPGERRGTSHLGRLSSVSNESLETEGLPGWMSGLLVDGVPYQRMRHPGLGESPFSDAAFPLSTLQSAQLLTNGLDVEWSGYAGSYLSSHSRRGTPDLQLEAFGDWSPGQLATSKYFDPSDVAPATVRGGFTISGPAIPDTAGFVFGVEARRMENPQPAAWTGSDTDSRILVLAQDSFGVDLSGYTVPRVSSREVTSAFARFDWRISDTGLATVHANTSFFSGSQLELGRLSTTSLGSAVDGHELQGALSLTSALKPWIWQELRIGIETSNQDFTAPPAPSSNIVASGFTFGIDPGLRGDFRRTTFRASETVHFLLGRNAFKVGVAFTHASVDDTYGFGRGGAFAFADTTSFERLEGAFGQAIGTLPIANLSADQFGSYIQAKVKAAPTLDLLLGLRFEVEWWSEDRVRLNQAWLRRTGLVNADLDRTLVKWSPRIGIIWDVRATHRWFVQGGVGTYYGFLDPRALGELVTSNRTDGRRGVGTLGRWPTAPDSVQAPVLGSTLTMLGPDFEPPRTFRTSLGVMRLLDDGWTIFVEGTFRHTSFLARRRDLNLPNDPSARDQFGRPLYGQLIKQGEMLTASPGSNRRFSGFGLISAINADGWSEYWGMTAGLEKQLGPGLQLISSYTYSQTRDNWFSARSGNPLRQLSPFPDNLDGSDWTVGRSDFDVPHRLVLGAELALSAGLRLGAFYRYDSGWPFTPGFRVGVDANGDGSASNDPAFIDEAVAGISDLVGAQNCLRRQIGRFVERNACREPSLQRFDLRLSLQLMQNRAMLLIEGLNLLDANVAVRDHAVYLVDANTGLSTDPSTTDVTVPLVANPNFGSPLWRLSTGRAVRVGFRWNY